MPGVTELNHENYQLGQRVPGLIFGLVVSQIKGRHPTHFTKRYSSLKYAINLLILFS
jgi:hypothetical protein